MQYYQPKEWKPIPPKIARRIALQSGPRGCGTNNLIQSRSPGPRRSSGRGIEPGRASPTASMVKNPQHRPPPCQYHLNPNPANKQTKTQNMPRNEPRQHATQRRKSSREGRRRGSRQELGIFFYVIPNPSRY